MTEREPRVPADPSGIEEPHDVLAAEEFGIGTGERSYPPDPSGIQEPHDVLAAEEFPMPAPDAGAESGGRRLPSALRALAPLLMVAAIVLVLLRRRS